MEDLRADFHPGMSRKRLRKKKKQERNVNNLIEYKNGVELWFLLAVPIGLSLMAHSLMAY